MKDAPAISKKSKIQSRLKESDLWEWRDSRLYHTQWQSHGQEAKPAYSGWIRTLIGKVYADQNLSKSVVEALNAFLSQQPPEAIGLNFGAGSTDHGANVINLDVCEGESIDIVNEGLELPFQDASLDFVLTQEVLEHVPDPFFAIREITRVLKPGGTCYCQLPFQIGFHPGPKDYWRFSVQGIQELFSGNNWEIQKVERSLGHGSGMYRIGVEFFAVTASCLHNKLYLPTKGVACILLWPIKLFDFLTPLSDQADRIPGGYWIVARKK